MDKEYKKEQEEYEKSEIERLEALERGLPKARTPPPEPNLGYEEFDKDDPKYELWEKGFVKLWFVLKDLKNPYDTPYLSTQKRIVMDALNSIFIQESYMSYDNYCLMIRILLFDAEFDYKAFTITQRKLYRNYKTLMNIFDRIDEENMTEKQMEDEKYTIKVRLYQGLKVILGKERKFNKTDYDKVIKQMY